MSVLNFNLNVFEEVPLKIEKRGIDLIVGREIECEKFMALANYGAGNIIITGAYGIGKTTMLLWAREKAFGGYFSITLGGDDIRSKEMFFYASSKNIINTLEYHPPKQLSPLSKSTLIGLENAVYKFIKGNWWKYEETFNQLISILENEELVSEERPLLIFIDDVSFAGEKHENIRMWLKTFTSLTQNVRFILTMQTPIFAKLSYEDPALLSRFNPRISLRFLNHDEIKEMLRRRIYVAWNGHRPSGKDTWYPFTEKCIDLIADESKGIPRKALFITKILFTSALDTGSFPITESHATKTLRNTALDTYTYVLKELGEKAIKIHDLLKKNGGCMKLKDIVEELGMSHSLVSYWIKKLIEEAGIVEKKANKRGLYCLTDPDIYKEERGGI